MRRKYLNTALILIMAIIMTSIPYTDYCVSADTINNQINNAKNEISDLKDKYSVADSQISEAQKKKNEMEESVKELDAQLTAAVSRYSELSKQQEDLKSRISQTSQELEEAAAEEENQYDSMKLRIQYMYEAGEQSYFEILMSSDNIVEFINNAAYIIELSLYDREKLSDYQATKKTIEDRKNQLEADEASLDGLVDSAKAQADSIDAIVTKKSQQVAMYKTQISKLEGDKAEFEEDIEEQTRTIAVLEQQIKNQQTNNNGSTQSEASSNTQSQQVSSNGFVWPCPASHYISSEYGYRNHPSSGKYSFHSGIDIAASMGSSILAAAGGTVTSAGWNGSMGNYVMISHGNGLVTIYMHASVLCVSSGQTVSAGQQIALVGSTGDSTGPHLHFSVRLNGSYVSPWSYL